MSVKPQVAKALYLGAQSTFTPFLSISFTPFTNRKLPQSSKEQKHKIWPREKGDTSSIFGGRLSFNKMQNTFLTKIQYFRKFPFQVCLETKNLRSPKVAHANFINPCKHTIPQLPHTRSLANKTGGS